MLLCWIVFESGELTTTNRKAKKFTWLRMLSSKLGAVLVMYWHPLWRHKGQTLPPIADFLCMNGASLNGHRQMYEWGASALCDITDANVQQIHFLRSAEADQVEDTIFPRLSGVSCQNTPPNGMFSKIWDLFIYFFFQKESWLQLSSERELWVCFT